MVTVRASRSETDNEQGWPGKNFRSWSGDDNPGISGPPIFHVAEAAQAAAGGKRTAAQQIFQVGLIDGGGGRLSRHQNFCPRSPAAVRSGKKKQRTALVLTAGQDPDAPGRLISSLRPERRVQKQGGVRMPVDADLLYHRTSASAHMNPYPP